MPTLTVSAPVADRSLVSLPTVKAELGVTDTASDALLVRWIKEDSDAVCAACGVAPDQMGRRTFLAEAVTISYRAEEVPGGHESAPLILPWRLPLGVATVTVDGAFIPTEEVECESIAGLLWRLSDTGNRTRWGRGRIVLAGTAGWGLDEVPAALSGAVTELVKLRWYERGRGDPLLRSYENPDVERLTYVDTDKMPMEGGLPKAVYDQLAPYRSPVFA